MNKAITVLYGVILFFIITSCGNSGKNKINTNPIEDTSEVQAIKPTVNIYIENSESMDGFVNKGNEFTDFITTYLTDISISFTDDINLNYINSKIIPIGKDITDFTNKLDKSTFKNKGGNRCETHIFQLLDTILKVKQENSISIFITDGIFSPGRGKDASKYVTDQYNGIKKSFSDFYKKNPNASVVIYQLSCQFYGTFFDRHDKPFPNTKETLPYYVWLIGDSKQLNTLIEKVPETKYKKNGIQNVFSISEGDKLVEYAVKRGSGNFDLNKKEPKTTIEKLKKETKGSRNTVRFSVNVNLSGFLLSNNYLLDTSNYELNNKNYCLTIDEAIPNKFGYTHLLNFESQNVHKGDVTVKLKMQIPKWVEEINDSIGTAPVKGKTYGIKYQIHGIYEAFTITNNYYTEIKIKIN